MRRWLRVLAVGALTVALSIDSASACRLFRSRCRPRCRVVTCQPCESIVIVESLPRQCCVPADGSAHPVIVEMEQAIFSAPSEALSAAAAEPTAPVAVDEPRPATPTPVNEPLEPLEPIEPIAPASAEKPLSPPPPAAPEPPMKEAPAEPASPPAPIEEPATPIEPVTEKPAAAPVPEEPEAPAEPAPKRPAPKPAAENFFDEDGDAADEAPARENRAPMKKNDVPKEPVEDLFDEPEADTPAANSETDPTEKPAEEAPSEEPTAEPFEKSEDDPFAALEADPEPVRRWIDSTGRHETIGRLVEVHSDRVRILKTNGRYTTVPMQQLSQHDRAYAATVGERLAGRAPARPAATDTAHR